MEQTQLGQELPEEHAYRAESHVEETELASDSALAKGVVAESRRQRRRILRGVSALLASWILLYTFLWLYERVGIAYGWSLYSEVIAPFLGISFLGSMALCALFSLPGRKQKEQLKELARTTDLNAIGPMVEMLGEIQPRATRNALREALTGLLPRLKESDALVVSTKQRAKLHRILEDAYWYHDVHKPDLALAILQAMGQIGDDQSLRVVRQLAHMKSRSEGRKRIRDAASEALELIELRIERRKSPTVLLRAASVSPGESALLRPAAESAASPAAILLRTTEE